MGDPIPRSRPLRDGAGTDHDHRVDYRSNPLGRLSDMRLGMTLGLVGYLTFDPSSRAFSLVSLLLW
jgi:hypothetical protein